MRKRKKFLERVLSLVIAFALVAGLIFSPTGVASASGSQGESVVEKADDPDASNVTPEPEPTVTPTPEPEVTEEPTPEPVITPEPTVTVEPTSEPTPTVVPSPTPEVKEEPDTIPMSESVPDETQESTTVPTTPIETVGKTDTLEVFSDPENGTELNDQQSYDMVQDNKGNVTVYVKFKQYNNLDDIDAAVTCGDKVCNIDGTIERVSEYYKISFKADVNKDSQKFEIGLRGNLREGDRNVPVNGTTTIELRVLGEKSISLSGGNSSPVYGDTFTLIVDGVEGRTISAVSSAPDVAEIYSVKDNQITVKLVNPTENNDKVTITVTASASADSSYATTETSYVIDQVLKKNLTISSDYTAIDAGQREYRPGDISVNATLDLRNHADVISEDNVQLNICGEIDGSAVASDKPYTWNSTSYELAGESAQKYNLIVNEDVKFSGTVTISRAQVYPDLRTNESDEEGGNIVPEVAYGNWSELPKQYYIDYYYVNGNHEAATELNDHSDVSEFLSVNMNSYPEYENGEAVEQADIITVNYSAYNDNNFNSNYTVVPYEGAVDSDGVKITWKENAENSVSFDEDNSEGIYKVDAKLVVSESSLLMIRKNDAEDSTFDTLFYRWSEEDAWAEYNLDSAEESQMKIAVSGHTNQPLQVYLAKQDVLAGYIQVSDVFEMRYDADLTAPTGTVSVKANTGSTGDSSLVISPQDGSETFDVYKYADKQVINVVVNAVDETPDDTNEVATGLARVAYQIIDVDDTTSMKEINSLVIDPKNYKELNPSENGSYSFDITNPGEKKAGSYIFLILLEDNIGNSVVYKSDGAILEVFKPEMGEIKIEGFGNGVTYDNNNIITVQLEAKENNSDAYVESGIEKIIYTWTVQDAEGKKTENSGILYADDISVGDGEQVFQSSFDISDTEDGSTINIQARAVDYAGNKSEEVTREIYIDNDAPLVDQISLENKGDQTGPDQGGIGNIPYINDQTNGAVVSFRVKERNLNYVTLILNYATSHNTAVPCTIQITKDSGQNSWTNQISADSGLGNVELASETQGDETFFTLKFKDEGHYQITSIQAYDILAQTNDEQSSSHVAELVPETDNRFVYDTTPAALTRAYYLYSSEDPDQSSDPTDLTLAGNDEILYVGKNGCNPSLVFEIKEDNVWTEDQAGELIKNVISQVTNLDSTEAADQNYFSQSIVKTEDGFQVVLSDIQPGRYNIQLDVVDYAGNTFGYRTDQSEKDTFVEYEDGFEYCIEVNNSQPTIKEITYEGENLDNVHYGNDNLSATVKWENDYLTYMKMCFAVQDYQGETPLDPVTYYASWSEDTDRWVVSSDSEVADTEAVEVKWQTETGKYTGYTVQITFRDPGDGIDREINILSITAYDKYKMDNCISEGFEKMVIDNTNPEVSVTHNYYSSQNGEQDGVALPNAYYNPGETEVTITVHERYFDLSRTEYTIDRIENPQISDARNEYLSKNAGDEPDQDSQGVWDSETHTWQITFSIPEDGKYIVKAAYEDYVGNSGSNQDEFIIDATAPEGKITVTGDRTAEGYGSRNWTGSWFERLLDRITFGLFSKEDTTVVLEASDLTAGVKSIEYLKDTYEVQVNEDGSTTVQGSVRKNPEDQVTAQDIENAVLSSNGELEWVKSESTSVAFTVEPNEQYVVYEKITDNAGNIWYLCSDGVIADSEAPTDSQGSSGPQITVNTQAAKNIYNGDVELSVSVEDPVNGTYSGIERVWYVVRAEGNVSKISDEITLIQDTETSQEQGNRIYTDTFKVFEKGGLDINEYNSNDVTVVVYAQDYSGNISSGYVNFAVDTTKPQIEVKYDSPAMPQHDFYYSQPRSATFTITERNLDYTDITDLTFYIQREDDTEVGEYGIVREGSRLYLANAAGDELEGIAVSAEDSQADRVLTPKQLSDDRKTTIKLTFNKDDAYTVSAKITDRAYNEPASTASEHFVVDNTNPVMQVSYYAVDSNGRNTDDITSDVKAGRVYKNQTIRCEITIDEHNFMLGDSVEGINVQVQVARNTADIADYHNLAQTSSWESNGDIRKLSYTFTLDGEYVQNVTYTDLSGRVVIDRQAQFNVDKTQPNGQIRIAQHDGWNWSSLLSAVTFGLFDQNGVTVNMNADDYTSPLQAIEYARFPQMRTLEQLETYNGWSSDGNEEAAFEKASSYGVGTNEQFIAYEKLTDYAGNVRYISSDGVVLDNTQPAPKITITNLSQASNGIFNEDVVLQIDVEDPTVGDTYAGLEKVWYTVSATGNVNTSNTITLMDNSSNRVQSHKTWSGTVTIPANVYNSNDVTVTAYAQDFAGNESHTEEKLKIDSTNPSISVTYDLNSPLNGQYYKDTRTATVTVTDRNFDPNNVHFTITNTDGTSASISGWSSSSGAGVSDSATHTATVSFSADGDYTFTLNCTDLAGNSTEYGQTDTFTIDKTVPEISVSYDNNNAQTSGYFKEQRTATISIHEHNFNASDVQAQITAQLEGQGINAPTIGRFSNSGDVHTATVTYATDGDYTFDIGYTDMAGNAAEDYTPDQFTVDLTAPEVEIIDIEDKSANNGVVSPGITYTDINYDTSNVTITLTGANNGTVTVGSAEEAIANGEKIKLNDFAYTEDMDDLYTLQVKVGDKAGNETEKSVMFSVNRYGSVYVLDDETKQWLSTDADDYTYINEEKPVGIIEYNVDDIEVSRITSDRDGDLNELASGTDYTVKKSGNDVQWKEYYYQIDASNFEEEGNYTLTLYSEDRAANTTNNTSLKHEGKELPLAFTVDKTAPTVVISGVENEGQYRSAERTMTIDAKDNLMLAEVTVDIDGEKTTYDTRTLVESDGIISVDLTQSNRWQTVKVTAKDAAGNALGSDEEREENGVLITSDGLLLTVLITPNILIQYYMNRPLFFGSIAVVVVILAVIVILLFRRRKQEEENRR